MKLTRIDDTEDEFVPQMEFVGNEEELGLTGLFNTFRMGDKWVDIGPGPIDLLVVDPDDLADQQVLDQPGMVLYVYSGGLDDMLELHSGLNHGCQQAMPADRKLELRRILETMYGRKLGGGELCVVLYMYREAD